MLPTGKYSVLYVLDGDWNFGLTLDCINAINSDLRMEQPIVVGIGYGKEANQRSRDYLPERGAKQFIQFLEQELIPFIQANYPTTEQRVLHGYSFGGVFATYALFQRPSLFQGVIIGSPGNNGTELVPQEKAYAGSHKDLTTKLFIGVGSQEPIVVDNIKQFTKALASRNYPSLKVQSIIADSAGHGLALPVLTLKALTWQYAQLHQRTKVDRKILARYQGRYTYHHNNGNDTINVITQQKKLFFKQAPNRLMELIPQSNNEFIFESDPKLVIRFIEKGGEYRMIADRISEVFEYKLIK